MKKIYIEITNNCNLNCSFCIKNSRESKFMTESEFTTILDKVKPYTKYLYFHVLGEPFLHPKINQFIDIAANDFFINITTNGYLIDRLKTKNIRQLNISLHSYSPIYGVSLENYLNNIFSAIDKLEDTYISYRFWAYNKYSSLILDLINKHYNTNYSIDTLERSNTLSTNTFINTFREFSWPSLDKKDNSSVGTCFALRDHVSILSDGTIVPCCLDSKGDINLGNIFKDDLGEVLKSDRVINMINGFKCNKKIEDLCKTCDFIELD